MNEWVHDLNNDFYTDMGRLTKRTHIVLASFDGFYTSVMNRAPFYFSPSQPRQPSSSSLQDVLPNKRTGCTHPQNEGLGPPFSST
jgi:hypothetical protein